MSQTPKTSYLDASSAVTVPDVEVKSPIENSAENLQKLSNALSAKFGDGLKINRVVIERGGKLPDGSRRVPLAVVTKGKPGGSLTVWVDRNDPSQLNCIWSGVITSALLDEAQIARL